MCPAIDTARWSIGSSIGITDDREVTMPYGSGQMVRIALLRAKPWQRYVISVLMVGVGVLLVAVGHVAGAVLAVAGVLLGWGLIRSRRRAPSTTRSVPADGDDRDGLVSSMDSHRRAADD